MPRWQCWEHQGGLGSLSPFSWRTALWWAGSAFMISHTPLVLQLTSVTSRQERMWKVWWVAGGGLCACRTWRIPSGVCGVWQGLLLYCMWREASHQPSVSWSSFFSSSDACLIKAYLIRLACMEMRNSLWWLHSWKRIHNSWQETFNKVISGKSLSIEFKILAINIPNAPGASVCIVSACFLQRQQSIFDEIEEYFICWSSF